MEPGDQARWQLLRERSPLPRDWPGHRAPLRPWDLRVELRDYLMWLVLLCVL